MPEHKVEQYGDEWAKLRLGKPTASGFHNIITPTGLPTRGLTRRRYLCRLVAERLLNQFMDDRYESNWMKRGSELEEEATKAFMRHNDKVETVVKAGFFTTSDGKVGASPDGIVVSKDPKMAGIVEGLECKCPAPYTQVMYLLDGPEDSYKAQVQGQMWICGFRRVHFWGWHPSMPPVYTVYMRDDHFIARLQQAVYEFLAEVDDAEAHCRGLGSYRLAEKLRLSEEMSVGDIMEGL